MSVLRIHSHAIRQCYLMYGIHYSDQRQNGDQTTAPPPHERSPPPPQYFYKNRSFIIIYAGGNVMKVEETYILVERW